MQLLSLNDKLALSSGRPTGFDYMRITLCIAVICSHTAVTIGGEPANSAVWHSLLHGPLAMLLPMFFSLSGFLVSGSLVRTTSLVQFLGLRAIRIYPALIVEVVLSALILGPLLTTVPLAHYFSSRDFLLYLLNVSGQIHYRLPGVFHDNPYRDIVNAQLWTVPYELFCYLGLVAITLLGIKKRPWLAPAATVLLMVIYLAARLIKHEALLPAEVTPGANLVISFLAGVSLYFFKERIPWSAGLCAASGIATCLLLGFVPYGYLVVVPFAAYFTISLGLNNPVKLGILRGADYSYGMYLYGFVIQQTLVATCPWAREWVLSIVLSVSLSAAFAVVSWHYVEKPALKLRRYLRPQTRRAPEDTLPRTVSSRARHGAETR